MRESPLWLIALLLSTVLILLWMYGTVAVALGAIGGSGALATSAGKELSAVGDVMLHEKWWIWAMAILTVLSVDVDRSIDLADLLRRYLFGVPDANGVTMRAQLRAAIAHVVPRVAAAGYQRVSIVSHSFGAVMALDYLAQEQALTRPLRLLTLGGFLKFLSMENPALVDPLIDACLANPAVSVWEDFYSKNDWLASTTPIRRPDAKFKAHSAVPYASLLERATGKSHAHYFSDQTVVSAILTPG